MEIDSDIVRLVHEIGFWAAGRADIPQATRIFEGMQAIRPNSVYPCIGLVYTLMFSGRPNEAITHIDQQINAFPDEKDQLSCYKGLAYFMAKDSEQAKKTWQDIYQDPNSQPEWKNVAHNYLCDLANTRQDA